MNCLLVDDEPGIREGLAALLRRQGHVVRTAADCAEAQAALPGDFDVVVTDWRLPDGVAATFVAAARAPVFVVSGHPEEVDTGGVPCRVMTKPVAPRELMAALAAAAAASLAPTPAPDAGPLPVDVQRALTTWRAALPAATEVELHDDGVFVTAVAEVPPSTRRPVVADGDASCRIVGDRLRVTLRLYRDGRGGTAIPVAAPAAPWPTADRFAIDFHGAPTEVAAFVAALERAAALRARGVQVEFWNVPAVLRDATSSHGTAHVMPMREPVGPRLQAELADLWRDP
jgi:CheY-like chemotaxis protein